jgi:hypothetical protein
LGVRRSRVPVPDVFVVNIVVNAVMNIVIKISDAMIIIITGSRR